MTVNLRCRREEPLGRRLCLSRPAEEELNVKGFTYVKFNAFKAVVDGTLKVFQAVFGAKIASSVSHHDCLRFSMTGLFFDKTSQSLVCVIRART